MEEFIESINLFVQNKHRRNGMIKSFQSRQMRLRERERLNVERKTILANIFESFSVGTRFSSFLIRRFKSFDSKAKEKERN